MAEFVTHHHFGLVRHHRSVRESFQVGVDGQEIARSSCRTVASADAANASAASGRIEIIGDGRSCRLVVRLSRLGLVDATERVGRHNEWGRPVRMSIKQLRCLVTGTAAKRSESALSLSPALHLTPPPPLSWDGRDGPIRLAKIPLFSFLSSITVYRDKYTCIHTYTHTGLRLGTKKKRKSWPQIHHLRALGGILWPDKNCFQRRPVIDGGRSNCWRHDDKGSPPRGVCSTLSCTGGLCAEECTIITNEISIRIGKQHTHTGVYKNTRLSNE